MILVNFDKSLKSSGIIRKASPESGAVYAAPLDPWVRSVVANTSMFAIRLIGTIDMPVRIFRVTFGTIGVSEGNAVVKAGWCKRRGMALTNEPGAHSGDAEALCFEV